MLTPTKEILYAAKYSGYAVGAFNVYNLEGVKAVLAAAEAENSPVILQLHPSALNYGRKPLVALCISAAHAAHVPAAVHLDHSSSEEEIRSALDAGMPSIMADGSHLSLEENEKFTKEMAALAKTYEASVEAEIGRLSGTEDELSVPEYEAKLTDPEKVAEFVGKTGVEFLAVCIGNVHGHYRSKPRLDFERLAAIRSCVDVPLVLHGASGLSDDFVRRSIDLGITKFNVNTEVREAYIHALKENLSHEKLPDLLKLMNTAVEAMQEVVGSKIRLFGSSGMAST
jgi:tagatose 1,6-diphosphate aldolase GatY/KbaY